MNSHLRVFVIDQKTGQPVQGVPVQIVAGYGQEARCGECEMHLQLLDSDHLGYVSTEIPVALDEKGLDHLWLRPFGLLDHQMDALPSLLSGPDVNVFALSVTEERVANRQKRATRKASINPTVDDWRISPGSFTSPDSLRLGLGDCEELLHNIVPERRYRLVQLVRDDQRPKPLQTLNDMAECEEPGQKNEFVWPSIRRRCYRLGVMLTYEVSWQPVGHALGRVIYSLPLAPCEAVNIAVIDWQRQDSLRRDENISNSEELRHSQHRDRDIEETLDAVLKEEQFGGSFMTGSAGAFGMNFGGAGSSSGGGGPFNLGATAALGGALSGTRGKRTLGADTSQRLIDSINQATSVMRRYNSTVVVQASNIEGEAIQTRTVRNHNHCHALTVLYYEVLRQYIVATKLVDKQDIVFVQYRPINDLWFADISFNDDVVMRHHSVLRSVLMEPAVACGFEAIAKRWCRDKALTKVNASLSSNDYLLDVVEVTINTAESSDNLGTGYMTITLEAAGQEISLVHGEDEYLYGLHPVPRPVPRESLGGFRAEEAELETRRMACNAGQEDIFRLRPTDFVRWGAISRVVISAQAGYHLQSIRMRTRKGRVIWTLIDSEVDHLFTETSSGHREPLVLSVNQTERHTAELRLSPTEDCCREALIQHLNDHFLYYCRAIWLNQDPAERAWVFDRYSIELPHPERSGEMLRGRLSDFIKNEIVGVSGDFVAFPLLRSTLAEEIGETNTSIRAGKVKAETVVALPSRGIFAEVKLSHCNSCEPRDPTRFWKWGESPCPEPPEILPVAAGGHEPADLGATTPTTLPGPVVNIVNPPSAPEPSGLSAALEMLSTPNIFRDMSAARELSDLLQKLSEGAVSLAGARAEANDIVARYSEPHRTPSRPTPAQLHDEGLVVESNINRAEEEGHITPSDARRFHRNRLESVVPRRRPPEDSPMTRHPEESVSGCDHEVQFNLHARYSDGNPLFGDFRFRAVLDDDVIAGWQLRHRYADVGGRAQPVCIEPHDRGYGVIFDANIQTDITAIEHNLPVRWGSEPEVFSLAMDRFVPTLQYFGFRSAPPLFISRSTLYKNVIIVANLYETSHSIRLRLSGSVEVGVAPSTEVRQEIAAQVGAALRGIASGSLEVTQGFRQLLQLSLASTVSGEGEVEATLRLSAIRSIEVTWE